MDQESVQLCSTVISQNFPNLPWVSPCQADVIEVVTPTFLAVGCAALILFTLYETIRLLIEASALTRSFKRIGKQIKAIPPEGKPLDGPGIERIREIMQHDAVMSNQWDEFEETLIIEKSANGVDQIFNTRQAIEFFHEEDVVNPRLNQRIFVALPGILTSLGLLLTFIAILIGLGDIHQVKDPATGVETLRGVEDLVFGLSGKFLSSITALVLATCFLFFERRQIQGVHRAYRKFIAVLDRRFSRLPTEKLLHDIRGALKQQAILFNQFGTDLSGNLKEGFREGLDPLIQRVAGALEELSRQKNESLADSMSGIISEFKNSLMSSTTGEFAALSGTLEKTSQMMASMNEQSGRTQEKMNELIDRLGDVAGKQVENGNDQIRRLATTMEATMDKLKEVTGSSSNVLSETVTQLLEKLERTTSMQMEESSRRAAEVKDSLSGIMTQLQGVVDGSNRSVESAVSNVLAKTSDWSEQTSAKLVSIMEEQTKNAVAIQDARQSLNQALEVFRTAVTQGSQTIQGLDAGSRAIQGTVVSLEHSVTGMSKAQGTVADLSSLAEKNLQQLSSVIDRQVEVLNQYQKVFSELDRNIGTLLSQIGTNLDKYTLVVKQGLESNLSQFDNLLQNATSRLGTTVQSLTDNLDTIVDVSVRAKGANAS